MQAYCGCGIRHNKGNEEKIMKAVWVIYYHMILGPSYESLTAQHFFSPDGKENRCTIKKDLFYDTATYYRSKCLALVFCLGDEPNF